MLGDDRALAWSNLGLWQAGDNYRHACQALAMHLADSIDLNSKDIVLDLACGQGASLELWYKNYKIQNIHAVELQQSHVLRIQQHATFLNSIRCDSFLNLNSNSFSQKFSAVLCIDAAYHVNLNSFLDSVKQVMQPQGRLAFHTLILSEAFLNLNIWQQKKYAYVLKAADVNLDHLMTQDGLKSTIMQHGFQQVQIEDLSEQVLGGFADYIQRADLVLTGLDGIKIKMTAKLCRKLYQDGFVRYVAVAAL
jgi:cyclopropane fatty-acyl-phospholipid synthase-like methyltransferase